MKRLLSILTVFGLMLGGATVGCHGSRGTQRSWEVWPDFGPQSAEVADPGTSWGAPDFGPGGSGQPGKAVAALKAADSCDEVVQAWKEAAIQEMRERLEAAWNEISHWKNECYPDYGWYLLDVVVADIPAAGDSGGGAQEYSTTNVQVAGVDEADWLKNDGQWIYVLADGSFQVISAWPPEKAHLVSRTSIQGRPIAMFVHQDIAVVFSSVGSDYYGGYSQCKYGYDCEFTGDGADTLVTVLDLADRAKPKLLRETWINGSYLTSRRMGPFVYVAVHFREPQVLPPGLIEVYPAVVIEAMNQASCGESLPLDPQVVKAAFEELYEQNKQKILAVDYGKWLPRVTDTVYVNGVPTTLSNPLTECEGYYLDEYGDGLALLSLLSFDMTRQDRLHATTIRSRPGAVFASKQSLYLAMRHYRMWGKPWYEGMEGQYEATTVHKFRLSDGEPGTTYEGSGVVKGRVLNQFSMGEHEGRLQIATTTGHLPGPTTNTVAVLEPKNGRLEVVGLLDGLAPNEDIRAVRFNGDIAFVVTFKKVDPLLVIDMSNPTKPVVKGELKIPGFSTYIHFLDPTHLLTIGFDAEDQGSSALFQGVMLQVFDVTDITKPSLLHKEVIGTRGTASEAAMDHLAFNYFAPKKWLAVPMVVCEGGSGDMFAITMTFNGLMVYEVTIENGFKYLGGIPHAVAQDPYYYGNCGAWWSQSSSTVKRSVFLDDYAVSVALDVLKFAHVSDLSHPVAEISLTQ